MVCKSCETYRTRHQGLFRRLQKETSVEASAFLVAGFVFVALPPLITNLMVVFMSIFIRKEDEKAQRLDKTSFENEGELQEYIHKHPETIPLYDLKDDLELLVAAREFRTNSGPIDAIAVDADGDLYIVETKLETNPDKRRVVSQALDYGAALWQHVDDFSEFISELDKHANQEWSLPFCEKVSRFFSLSDEQAESFLTNLRSNLNDGIFKIVVMMDSTDKRLRDIILYVNKNSQFDIYAIDFNYYNHEKFEIVIPQLYGSEVKKDIGVSDNSSKRKSWGEDSFFEDLKDKTNSETQEAVREIYSFYQEKADSIGWGTGSSRGSFIPRFPDLTNNSMFTVYSDGKITLQFGYLNDNPQASKALFKRVNDLEGIVISEYPKTGSVSVPATDWVSISDEFLDIFESIRNDFSKTE